MLLPQRKEFMKQNLASHVPLPSPDREALVSDLNAVLATTVDLNLQVKQAHWNIKGPQFFARHELFDKLAAPLHGAADTIAERASTLGGYAQGTVRLTALGSILPEYDLTARDGQQHIEALVARYTLYARQLRELSARAEALGDPVTVDVFTEILREAELSLWFLESHLQGSETSKH